MAAAATLQLGRRRWLRGSRSPASRPLSGAQAAATSTAFHVAIFPEAAVAPPTSIRPFGRMRRAVPEVAGSLVARPAGWELSLPLETCWLNSAGGREAVCAIGGDGAGREVMQA